MSNLTNRLTNRIDVWGKVEIENELHEVDYSWQKIKSIWSEITVTGGTLKNSVENNTYADISHKITIREKSIPNLSNVMYFIYKGQRFNIKFYQNNYKYKDSIEIMCSLVVE